jgi:hypothetical protein
MEFLETQVENVSHIDSIVNEHSAKEIIDIIKKYNLIDMIFIIDIVRQIYSLED